MPRQRYQHRPKRRYTARQMAQRAQPAVPNWHRGMGRKSVWKWLYFEWDGDLPDFFAKIETLRDAERWMIADYLMMKSRFQLILCLYPAALEAVPDKGDKATYHPAAMLTCVAMRLCMGIGHRKLVRHLDRHAVDCALLFGKMKPPKFNTLLKFELSLREREHLWEAFLCALSRRNPGMAEDVQFYWEWKGQGRKLKNVGAI